MALSPPAPLPEAPAAPAPVVTPMSFAVSPCEGPIPGGPKWVCIVFSDALYSQSVRLPVEQMEQLMEQLPQQVADCIYEARRLTTGLVLPSEVSNGAINGMPAR